MRLETGLDYRTSCKILLATTIAKLSMMILPTFSKIPLMLYIMLIKMSGIVDVPLSRDRRQVFPKRCSLPAFSSWCMVGVDD